MMSVAANSRVVGWAGHCNFEDHKAASEAIFTLDVNIGMKDGQRWYVGSAKFHHQDQQEETRHNIMRDVNWKMTSGVECISSGSYA